MIRGLLRLCAFVTAFFVFTAPFAARADAVGDFYKGKHITVLISAPPGSGYDGYARLMARHLGRFVSGNPGMIARNMPGAGGMVLLNHAYNAGPRDGTLLFTLHFNLPLYQAMGGRGVKFDASKLIGLGRLLASNAVIGVWSQSNSGVRTIEDAKMRQAVIGGTGATSNSVVFPTIMNNMLGTKFKVVTGYAGASSVFLAMERGEIDGFGSFSYLTFKSVKPSYLDKKLFNPIVQFGNKREAAWPDVPTAIDLAETATDKRAMEAAVAGPEIGFSYFMPPDVPGDRVAALRGGFDKMVGDSKFLKDAARAKMPLRTATASEVEALVASVLSAPPDVIERLRGLMVLKGGVRCADYGSKKLCRKARKKKKKE